MCGCMCCSCTTVCVHVGRELAHAQAGALVVGAACSRRDSDGRARLYSGVQAWQHQGRNICEAPEVCVCVCAMFLRRGAVADAARGRKRTPVQV